MANLNDVRRALAGDKSLSGADLSGADLSGADLSGADLWAANLMGASLQRASLSGANLISASLQRADLSGATLTKADLSGAELSGATLTKATLTKATLSGADLSGTNLSWNDLSGTNLSGTNLSGTNLSGTNLSGTNLYQASLYQADLTRAILTRANLRGANLMGANLTRASLYQANLMGANLTRADLTKAYLEANLTEANLTEANLTEADLRDASLTRANLSGANLPGATLTRASLTRANLSGANLSGANLPGATLTRANLTLADLTGADLTKAYLRYANLTEANLTRAELMEADLRGADLTGAKNVEIPMRREASAYGRASGAVLKLLGEGPQSAREFKRKHPAEFEKLKALTGGRDFDEATIKQVVEKTSGVRWIVTGRKYTSKTQRLCPQANSVLLLNLDLDGSGLSDRQRKSLGRLAEVSKQSGHPHEKGSLFTVGWVRYCDGGKTWLVEEVQSDVALVRFGLKDEAARKQLQDGGVDPAEFEDAIKAIEPYTERFYEDAIGVTFAIAKEGGIAVEMLDYQHKFRRGVELDWWDDPKTYKGERKMRKAPPERVYTDLPKSMGMSRRDRSEVLPDAPAAWYYRPNPRKRRRS